VNLLARGSLQTSLDLNQAPSTLSRDRLVSAR
jgi:hypothetical protein